MPTLRLVVALLGCTPRFLRVRRPPPAAKPPRFP